MEHTNKALGPSLHGADDSLWFVREKTDCSCHSKEALEVTYGRGLLKTRPFGLLS